MSIKRVRSIWPGTTHEDTHFGFLLSESRSLLPRYARLLAWLPTPHFSFKPSSSEPPRSFPRWSELPREMKDAILEFAFSVPQGEEPRQIALIKHYYDPMESDALWREPPSPTLLRRVQCSLGFQNKSCNCLSAENSYSMLCHPWPRTRSLQSRSALWMRCFSACRISCRTHRGITAIASHSLCLLSIYFPSSSIDCMCSRRSSD